MLLKKIPPINLISKRATIRPQRRPRLELLKGLYLRGFKLGPKRGQAGPSYGYTPFFLSFFSFFLFQCLKVLLHLYVRHEGPSFDVWSSNWCLYSKLNHSKKLPMYNIGLSPKSSLLLSGVPGMYWEGQRFTINIKEICV